MHYMSFDWMPSAILLCTAVVVVATVRMTAWLGQRLAIARTHRAIDRVLNSDLDVAENLVQQSGDNHSNLEHLPAEQRSSKPE